jgi:quinol monooxygenase YgiN
MPSTNIEILIRFDIKPENLTAFRAKIAELTSAISVEEPGTSSYDFFLDESNTTSVLSERYPDSDAFLAHIARTGPHLPSLLALATPASVYVLGSVSPKAREMLVGFGAKFLSPVASLSR